MEAFALFLFYFPLEEEMDTFLNFLLGGKWPSQDQNRLWAPARGEGGGRVAQGGCRPSPQFPPLLNSPFYALQTGLCTVSGHPCSYAPHLLAVFS